MRGGAEEPPCPEAQALLAGLLVDPSTTAVVTDFDGTLASIVEDPPSARPLDGVPGLLHRLAQSFGVVAVVSGRPASFLAEHLRVPSDATLPTDRLHLIGLYGLESIGPDGSVVLVEAAAAWLPVVADTARRIRAAAPDGVLVEVKGAAVTVHWRPFPEAEGWILDQVAEESSKTGLTVHLARRSVELRPPLSIDKGTVLRRLTDGCTAACFLGDDVGDIPAFVELARRGAEGLATVGVAVIDEETDPEVAASADLSVTSPHGAVGVLTWLAAQNSSEG